MSAVSGTVLQMNRQGWSCLGPVSVSSFSPDTLTLFYPKKNLEIALKGKQVRIMDHRLQAVSTSTISSGTWIYVCRKGGEVVIYRLPGGKEGQE